MGGETVHLITLIILSKNNKILEALMQVLDDGGLTGQTKQKIASLLIAGLLHPLPAHPCRQDWVQRLEKTEPVAPAKEK